MPEHPEGNRNLYALSKNSSIWFNDISNLVQNVATGEISFKVSGRDPHFGNQANKDEAVGTNRGVKIPVKTGQDIAVQLTNELFTKNFVSYFGDDDRAVKNFKTYQTNKFVIQANELEGVSYVTFRFGLVQETQAVGSVHSTKIKVEYGTVHTDWSPSPEDLGWSTTTLVPTQEQRYLWKFEYIYYSDGSVEVTDPINLSIAGQNGATGNGIANTVVTYGLSVSDTTEPTTWSSDRPTLVKGMYLWTRTVIIYTNGESTTSYQISYIAKDADATAAIDKTKQELLEKLDTVRNDSLAAVEEAKQQLETVRDESLAAAEEAKQQVTTVANELSTAKQDFQNAVSAVDTKATNLQSDLTQAKQDLASQAQQLQEQAGAQSELTNRVSSVEKTANGTKTTVSELSKTVAQNGKDITSVTARTKTVEDDLAGTKTTLSQVKTTADSTSQKTATLETGLNGLSAKFDSLKIGAVNLLHNSKGPFQPKGSKIDNYVTYSNTWINMENGKEYTLSAKGTAPFTSKHATDKEKNEICLWLVNGSDINRIISSSTTGTDGTKFTWNDPSGRYYLRVNTYKIDNSNYVEEVQIEEGNLRSTYSQNESDIESKVAEYKQTADQNYASLSSTVQNLDGTVQQNKTTAEQTAAGFKTRIESLETYKDGETTRANQYFESAKTETARQLTVERTAIAKDYVAKSTYTSDVTGIRNELSATTSTANATKTNLANYQASNDKVVASLKSSLQTTDGNVSNLQTKVEAVPGQITSAVSAVEGKIPTEIGGRNLYALSKNAGIYTIDITDFVQNVETGEISFKVTGRDPFFGSVANKGDAFGTSRGVKIPVKTGQGIAVYLTNELFVKNFVSYFGEDNNAVKGFKNYQTNKFVISASELEGVSYVTFRFGIKEGTQEVGSIHSTKVKVEYGNVYTDWSPAPEDTVTQISNLSSQIQQTADGMTLLATKTELNTAKTELQSGITTATNKANNAQSTANSNAQTISTHTTQISALNTGLSAKVSQTDFNTLSGRVTTAENNIIAKANELTSKITSVEEKIPTSVGGRNLIIRSQIQNGYIDNTGYLVSSNDHFTTGFIDATNNKQFTITAPKNGGGLLVRFRLVKYSADKNFLGRDVISYTQDAKTVKTITLADNVAYFKVSFDGVYKEPFKIERGNLPTDWSPAPEDTVTQISNLSSQIQQTADGMTLLATKTELNNAKNELQSGINTANNKANNNAQTISTHTTQISALNTGLSAKVSQTDFNTLSGRVTTAENNITAKANELSSKITTVEGKIPSGEMNLVEYGRPADGYSPYAGAEYTTHPFYYNGAYKMYIIKNTATSEKMLNMNRFKVERNTEYTLYFKGFNNDSITNIDVWFLKRVSGSTKDWDSAQQLVIGRKLSTSRAENISVTFNTGNYDEGYLRFDNNGTTTAGEQADLYFGDVSVKKGKSNNGWSPSLAELASSQDLKNAQSEFKQTTDSIKASVTSLDKSTVKSSSLTINSDGIVMKAGKSTTDVANAIGSYFSVNQNAINLFSDKINVKGSMIVDGAITGDKIKANSVDVTKIVGIDADFIKSKIEYAMIDWLKGKTITAYNDNMTIDLQNGRISFKDGSNAVYRQTPDGIHTGFLHFEAGSQGGIYAAFGATSTRQGINSKSSEFAGIRCYRVSANGDSHEAKIDKIEVIGDTIQFGHGYISDGDIGGGFIMQAAELGSDIYSLNRVVKSIDALWRILHDHAKNTGYRFNDSAFINALNNEYNAWHDMRNQ